MRGSAEDVGGVFSIELVFIRFVKETVCNEEQSSAME